MGDVYILFGVIVGSCAIKYHGPVWAFPLLEIKKRTATKSFADVGSRGMIFPLIRSMMPTERMRTERSGALGAPDPAVLFCAGDGGGTEVETAEAGDLSSVAGGVVLCIGPVLLESREESQGFERVAIRKRPKTTITIRITTPAIASMFNKSFFPCSLVIANFISSIVTHAGLLSIAKGLPMSFLNDVIWLMPLTHVCSSCTLYRIKRR